MEPEVFNIEDALKVLALLSAIPVVLFALWGDYLERRIAEPPEDEDTPPIDLKLETEKVRMTSLCVVLFLFTLLIGSFEIRQVYPIATQLIFCTSVLVQLWTQSRIEKKINPNKKGNDPILGVTMRAIVSWIVGAFIYISCVFISCRLGLFFSHIIQASQNMEALIFSIGCMVGVLGGLAFNFALTPIFLKKIFPLTQVNDQGLETDLTSCFNLGKVAKPQLWIIEMSQLSSLPVFLAGFQKGKGVFCPALFIPRTTLTKLNSSEMKALILNQVSHAALKHTRKKIILSFCLILLTTFLSISSFVISHTYFPQSPNSALVGPFVAMMSFFLSFKLIIDQMQRHQLKADLYSIQKLGVEFRDFALYLRKLENQTGENIIPGILAHPETEKRIKRVEDCLGQEHSQIRDSGSLKKAA